MASTRLNRNTSAIETNYSAVRTEKPYKQK